MPHTEEAMARAGACRVRAAPPSARAPEHPANDHAEDVGGVGVPVEPHGAMSAAAALGAELERGALDGANALRHRKFARFPPTVHPGSGCQRRTPESRV